MTKHLSIYLPIYTLFSEGRTYNRQIGSRQADGQERPQGRQVPHPGDGRLQQGPPGAQDLCGRSGQRRVREGAVL